MQMVVQRPMNPRRAKTWDRLEVQYGKPFPQVLVDAINESGSVSGAARELKMSLNSAWYWVRLLSIHTKTIAFLALK